MVSWPNALQKSSLNRSYRVLAHWPHFTPTGPREASADTRDCSQASCVPHWSPKTCRKACCSPIGSNRRSTSRQRRTIFRSRSQETCTTSRTTAFASEGAASGEETMGVSWHRTVRAAPEATLAIEIATSERVRTTLRPTTRENVESRLVAILLSTQKCVLSSTYTKK